MTFVTHNKMPTIEIQTSQPFIIRGSFNHEICEEYTNPDDGNIYVKIPVHLNNSDRILEVQKARLIADQFIENTDPLKFNQILFEDRNKLNLNPENLYWCDTNQVINRKYNKRRYVQELPADAKQIRNVSQYFFDHYYYSPSKKELYLITRNDRIQIVSTKTRAATISFGLQDTSGRTRNFTMASFLKNMNTF